MAHLVLNFNSGDNLIPILFLLAIVVPELFIFCYAVKFQKCRLNPNGSAT